jgi:lipopolysaccharide/colanic/teichoic acid biosynthesis glycosyltransferase
MTIGQQVPVAATAALRPDTRLRRAVDLAIGSVSLAVAAPVIAVLAVVVWAGGGGSPIYAQERVGRGGKPFTLFKLRSMRPGSDRGALVTGAADDRVTAIGAVLRRTKLDELPQLWNVVRGDMTFVGPRPEVERFVRSYRDEELAVLAVRPGLTGIGQVLFTSQAAELDGCADPDQLYLDHQMRPKLAADLAYLRRRTWRSDLGVLARTLLVITGPNPAQGRKRG